MMTTILVLGAERGVGYAEGGGGLDLADRTKMNKDVLAGIVNETRNRFVRFDFLDELSGERYGGVRVCGWMGWGSAVLVGFWPV